METIVKFNKDDFYTVKWLLEQRFGKKNIAVLFRMAIWEVVKYEAESIVTDEKEATPCG